MHKLYQWGFNISLLFLVGWSLAQNIKPRELIISRRVSTLHKTIVSQDSVSALVVKKFSHQARNEPLPRVLTKSGLYTIPLDPDADPFTFFLSFSVPESILSIESVSAEDSIFFILYSSVPQGVNRGRINEGNCEKPVFIEPNDWRQGLPEPKYARTYQSVSHVILHHSAGSNFATDYTKLVRDIYLYHTEINGWSDIGYNFLVAPDGSLYIGRDPQGKTALEVMGAHFCGKNGSTLGLCMLGNYEDVVWQKNSRESLIYLLAFIKRELNIDFNSSSLHQGKVLGHLSGHRDGCSTLCPGENIYKFLGELPQQVLTLISECENEDILLNIPDTAFVGQSLKITATADEYENFRWKIAPSTLWVNAETIDYIFQNPGKFQINFSAKLINTENSVFMTKDIVIISPPPIIVFPNPSRGCFTLEGHSTEQAVNIYDTSGKKYVLWLNEEGTLCLNASKSGVYIIELFDQLKHQKSQIKLVIE